jgi:hypothetical protein
MNCIQAEFAGFHERNPIVYRTLVRLARQARARRRDKIGIAMLWERMRWELTVEVDTPDLGDSFKLNNNYRSRYARLIMAQEKDLEGFFDTRRLHDDDR